MRNRGIVVMAVLAVCAAGVIALARPAAATQVIVEPGSPACSDTVTVVPDFLGWGRAGWEEDGAATEVGSCEPGSTGPVITTGRWQRYGEARNPITGQCPSWDLFLDTGPSTELFLWEMTDESTMVQSPQLIGANPFFVNVPFGTDTITERIPLGGVGLAETDASACASWPTATNPPPVQFPTPPPFQIRFFGPPGGGQRPPASVLSVCLTMQGVLPRTCLNV